MQSSEIDRLLVQYLAIYRSENLSKSIFQPKLCQVLNTPLKILPDWRNFAKSGHTAWVLMSNLIFDLAIVLGRYVGKDFAREHTQFNSLYDFVNNFTKYFF